MAWIDVREPEHNRLVFRFNPETLEVESRVSYWDREAKERIKFTVVVDLRPFLRQTYAQFVHGDKRGVPPVDTPAE